MGGPDWVPRRRICETNLPKTIASSSTDWKITVNILKQIGQALGRLTKQNFALPNPFATALKQRRLRAALAAGETERLDRIRNPEKYRGK